MKSPRRLITLLAAIVAAVVAPAALATAAPHLQATLAGTGTPTTVRLTIGNDGDRAAHVPIWLTGADGIVEPILEVTREGVSADYTGPVAKRRAATPADMVTIPAGTTATWVLPVARAYALPASGAYALRYHVVLADGTDLDSPTIGMDVPPEAVTPPLQTKSSPTRGLDAMAVSYTSCGATQREALPVALAAADDYARAALAYFASARHGARYTWWFGTYDATRWSTAQAHFTAIRHVTGDGIAAFDCSGTGCTAGVFAFVYPSTPYVVHPCGAFWDAAVTGTDSRAGTLIHEVSHFTVVAGTDDWAYGQTAAHALVGTNVAHALNNADNHEYFAENNPAQDYVAYSASAQSVAFGAADVGATSPSHTITLTSTGDVGLHITSVSTPSAFPISATTCDGATLAPNATCTITLAFSPIAGGSATGAVTVDGNVDMPVQPVTLTGAGNVHVSGVTVDSHAATLAIGGTLQLTAAIAPADATNQAITWTSSAPGVASVNGSGLVTATSGGTATITATTADGSLTDVATITVTQPTPASAPADPAPVPTPVAEPVLTTPALPPSDATKGPAPTPLAGSAACTAGRCATRGTVPANATKVTVSAVRKGTPRATRGTCKVTRRANGANYACGIALTKGTWVVTTQAVGAGGVVATSTVTKTVR